MTDRRTRSRPRDSGGTPGPADATTRLHIVTGKGGTGKTTVAAALALALASEGRKVLLCEVEGRQGIASIFDVAPLPYAERLVALGPDEGGEVFGLAIDAEAALLEYLDLFYRLGRAGKALDRFGAIDFATTIAPGLSDVLLTGKVYEAARRREGQGPQYDAVVLDAPPTGRIGRFLNVNSEVAGIAKVGPIRKQASSIMTLLKSDVTRVHLVSTLEDMPVQETIDGVAELHELGLQVGVIVVNMVREAELGDPDLDAALDGALDHGRIEKSLARIGVSADDTTIAGLAREARRHAERVRLEAAQRAVLESAGPPLVTLPLMPEGIDLGALYDLAERLRTSKEF